eukprot:4440179-Amphidinium_carterae.1
MSHFRPACAKLVTRLGRVIGCHASLLAPRSNLRGAVAVPNRVSDFCVPSLGLSCNSNHVDILSGRAFPNDRMLLCWPLAHVGDRDRYD